jgi:predicted PhzF superfamily epimerase YddE/YHI9
VVPLFVVDSFTDRPFSGNPAGVCLLPEWREDTWLQSVAAEMRHAETAFLVPAADGFDLRWFTPTVEVDLCGHATLASAHVLYRHRGVKDVIRFNTKSGVLTARDMDGFVELDFPAEPPEAHPLPSQLACIGEVIWQGKNRMDWFVQLESAEQVRQLVPDMDEIAALGMRGLLVTATGESPFDFVSRCFFPQSGVDEDPATGSAHCAFAPYWSTLLGKTRMTAYQASPRGGMLEVECLRDRVLLRGKAVSMVEGVLHA